MEYLTLQNGVQMPLVGFGTFMLSGETCVKAVAEAIQSGYRMIDTAEAYGNEKEVGAGIRASGIDRRELFLVTKVNFKSYEHAEQTVMQSLENLGTDYLDLYLLHWRGSVPLSETVACMEELKAQGKIRRWGVSNFDLSDMQELLRLKHGENCAVVQDLYHLGSRGIEYDLLPFLRRQSIPLMAYSPLAQAGRLRQKLLSSAAIQTVAENHSITPIQVLLAFVLAQDGVFAIPRASRVSHVQANCEAADVVLSAEELALLNEAFPAPTRKVPLDMI